MKNIVTIMCLCLCSCLAHGEVYSDNVVVVLDASGSMNDRWSHSDQKKITVAIESLSTVLSLVNDSTQIGVVVFGGVSNPWVYPLATKDEAKIRAALQRVSATGGTPLGKFIKIGADRLLEQRETQLGYGTYRLLVVTDGEAGDQELVNKFAPEVMARGITLDVIGVDMENDHTLAKTSHKYRSANDPASLKSSLQEALAEVSVTQDLGDDFELLNALPDGCAEKIIQALSNSGNQPLGQRPAIPYSEADTPSARGVGTVFVVFVVIGGLGVITVFFLLAKRIFE